MLSLDFGFVCIFVCFDNLPESVPTRVGLFERVNVALTCKRHLNSAHLTESRVLFVSEFEDDPYALDHTEEVSREGPLRHPILSDMAKRIRNSKKKTIVQYGRHIYHLDDYDDRKELRSKLQPESIAYDYVDMDKLIRADRERSVKDLLKDLLVLSDRPVRVCYGEQGEGNYRKSSKKHKKHDDDEIDWKNKKMPLPLHIKRFQIVDNKHNSVRDSKFGSDEKHEKTSKSKKKKNSSGSEESQTSRSEEVNNGRSHEKNDQGSESASFEKWKNHEENLEDEDVISKKKSKKKKKEIEEPDDDTIRKTIPVEETYFVQGNKIYHSNGKNKKKHDDFDKRRRLEHFLPKRYHWDPSDIHQLGYYWFNGPKGIYPEPRPLSI